MPRNIEIKARIDSVDALLPRARALADGDATLIEQDDSFYAAPHGRLKLRRFADGSAELIHYHRPDGAEARASDYVRVPVADAAALHAALVRACGERGRVRKRRWLLMAGATRIHLDRVEGLGVRTQLELDATLRGMEEGMLIDPGPCWRVVRKQLSNYTPVHPLLAELAEDGWPNDHYSICTFVFEKVPKGTKLKFTQTGIPEHKAESLKEGWKEFYWNRIKEFLSV